MKPIPNSHLLRKIRVALTPRSCLLRTRLSNGVVVSGYNRAGYGGRGIYVYKDELEPELHAIQHFLRPGDVFVDIGANVGVYTLKAAKEIGNQGVVVAVEPFVQTAHQLVQNVSANGFQNVRVRNLCMAGKTGEVQLYLNMGKPNSFALHRVQTARSISVLGVSLDDLCRWEGLKRLSYLKIDAEGAEAVILEGGTGTISRFRPIIQVEMTKVFVREPTEYRCFAAPGSMNRVLIPGENTQAISEATKMGWQLDDDRPDGRLQS